MNAPQTSKTAPAVSDDPEIARALGIGAARTPLWRRRGFLLVALAALAIAAVMWSAGAPRQSVRYVTEPATRADVIATVTATGAVAPTNQVEISSELSGTIRRVHVDFNDTVTKGQTLAELDTDTLQATVDSARAKRAAALARVREAEATVTEKRLDYDRKNVLAERSIASEQERDVARAAHLRALAGLESAKADRIAAEADLTLAETNLAKACICSPIDGVVLSRAVEPGQTVAASFQAPILFTLAEDLSAMEIQVDVDEADVGRVKEGQTARFTVDAYPGRRFSATIRSLHYGSEVVQGVVTYKAVLETDNAEGLLRPGMTATAEIVVNAVRGALTAPNAALRYAPAAEDAQSRSGGLLSRLLPRPPRATPRIETPDGPERTLWTLRDGAPSPIEAVIGETDGARTAILSGDLTEGMALIVDAEAEGR